jgi:hypothetical protein
VVAYINKEGGTRSRSLMAETGVLFNLVRSREWTLKASYIPRRLNVIADQLSRQGQILPLEWSLHQEAADMLFSTWGKPFLDLFATRTNKKCMLYVSPVPDPQALGVDALTMDLEGEHGYAYPPHQILSKFLQKVQLTRKYNLIVIKPYWPNQPWFPVFMALTEENPIPLPNCKLKAPNIMIMAYLKGLYVLIFFTNMFMGTLSFRVKMLYVTYFIHTTTLRN